MYPWRLHPPVHVPFLSLTLNPHFISPQLQHNIYCFGLWCCFMNMYSYSCMSVRCLDIYQKGTEFTPRRQFNPRLSAVSPAGITRGRARLSVSTCCRSGDLMGADSGQQHTRLVQKLIVLAFEVGHSLQNPFSCFGKFLNLLYNLGSWDKTGTERSVILKRSVSFTQDASPLSRYTGWF